MKSSMTTFGRALAICLALGGFPLAAFAYEIQYSDDRSTANIYCDDGNWVHSFSWNGTQWTDGIRLSNTDLNALARRVVSDAGSACQ